MTQAQQTPIFQVLDIPKFPLFNSKLQLRSLIFLGFIIGFFISAIICLIKFFINEIYLSSKKFWRLYYYAKLFKKKQSSKINVFASLHLESLHKSLNYPFEDNIRIEFIDFKIYKGILPFFTNKYFFTFSNIYTLINLKKFLNAKKNVNFIIEQDKRLRLFNLLLGRNYTYIHSSINNIYNSYSNFLNSKCDNESIIHNLKKSLSFLILEKRKSN